jgi:hypothetical protein
LTIEAGATSTTNGWIWASTNTTLAGLRTGEVPTNGLNVTSYWAGGIELSGDGIVGTYTLDTTANTWTINYQANEGMVYYDGTWTNYPNTHRFKLVDNPDAFPANGTGPQNLGRIEIYAPYALPPKITSAVLAISNGMAQFQVIGVPSNQIFYVDKSTDGLVSWITNNASFISSGVTNNQISITNTDPSAVFRIRKDP